MSRISCDSCDNLRENAPAFVQGGVSETICASLKNNTGLNPSLSTLHTNEEDLHDANDCLIGSLDELIDMYEPCDWKEFMHRMIPNLYETLKAMICSESGAWKEAQSGGNMCESVTSLLDLALENIPQFPLTLTDKVQKLDPSLDTSLYVRCARKKAYDCDGNSKNLFMLALDAGNGLRANHLSVGDVMGTIKKSVLVPTYMSEGWWNQIHDRTPYSSQICCFDGQYFVQGSLHGLDSPDDEMAVVCEAIVTGNDISGNISVLHPQVTTFRDIN